MTPLPDALLESVAAAAVREGLADAVFTRLRRRSAACSSSRASAAWSASASRRSPRTACWPRSPPARPADRGSDRELGAHRDTLDAYFAGEGDPHDLPVDLSLSPRRSGARCSRRCTTRSPAARSSPTAPSPAGPATRAPPRRRHGLRPQPGPDPRALPPRPARRAAASAATAAARSASARCSSSRAAQPSVTLTDWMTTGSTGCSVAGRSPDADLVDDVLAAGHLAEQRVVGREPRVLGGDDEELAARGPGGSVRSWPSPPRPSCTRGPSAAPRRPSSRGRRCRRPSGRRPGSRSRPRCGGTWCRRRSPCRPAT